MAATISGSGTSTLIDLTTSGNTTLGDATTDTLTVGVTGIVKDASGNVGIGTSSPATILHVKAASPVFRQETTANVTTGGVASQETKDSSGAVVFTQGFAGLSNCYQFGTAFSNGFMRFLTGSAVEAMRIDSSGNLLVGATTIPDGSADGVAIRPGASRAVFSKGTTSSASQIGFFNPNGLVGSISTSASATSYSTSSDYRLKENVQPMTGALAKVAALNPCTYTWKSDGSAGQGFIAHELAEVEAGCVTGEKDAVDENGNPVYQGIDTSFLVATLTAAIQEQQALIQQLQADVAALKGKA